jgi:hypothetical protein
MLLQRILSGGRPGAEAAALEAALAMGIACGGWRAPEAEAADGDDRCGLKPLPAGDPRHPDEANVEEAHGTLSVSYGPPSGHASRIGAHAERQGRPWLHIDLLQRGKFEAAMAIRSWLVARHVAVLHVTGGGAFENPAIRGATLDLIESVTYLLEMSQRPGASPPPAQDAPPPPRSVQQAVERLSDSLSLKDRILIANLSIDELPTLHPTLGDYILSRFDLVGGGGELLAACRFFAARETLDPQAAMTVILEALWRELRRTHRLRIVKA